MNCRKCGGRIPDGHYSGVCGSCAFRMFEEAATPQFWKIQDPRATSNQPARATSIAFEPSAAPPPSREYDRELEMTVINGFLNDQYLLGKTLNEGFEREMLSSPEALAIFDEIQQIYGGISHEKVVDPLIIRNRLKSTGQLSAKLEKWLDACLKLKTPQLSQILAYLRILKEQIALKKLFAINKEISEYLSNPENSATVSFTDFTATVTKRIRDIQSAQAKNNIELVKSQMLEIAQDLAEREAQGERECLGYSLRPFNDLTAAISGLRKGFLYGIAGAPRRGKTTFTLEVATLVAANSKVPVLFFTWEQTKKNLTYRLLAKETRINPDTLQRKNIRANPQQNLQFAEGWRRMEGYMNNLYIIEGSKDDTVDRIKAHAYNAMQDAQVDEVVIVCDYLQKMPLSKSYSDEKFRVEEISTDLKRLSIELNAPIIVISSLNKEGCLIEFEESDDERPGLYHCKGSGDVEYDLDCAMVMTKNWGDTKELMSQMSHRAEARGKDPIHIPKIDIIDLYLDKNRDAPEGRSNCVQYFFFIEENRFFELGFKETTNAFRYNRIETLLNQLEEEGFVRYRDIEGKRAEPTPAVSGEATAGMGDAPRRKIRLKRE